MLDDLTKQWFDSLTKEEQHKIILYNNFNDKAKEIFDWLQFKSSNSKVISVSPHRDRRFWDGVYYVYEDGTNEWFNYEEKNSPSKPVEYVGIIMGDHTIAVSLNDLPDSTLTNTEDETKYNGYIEQFDDAVADWNGKQNTEHIKQIGTDIELLEGQWIPSIAELYLIYLNKRSVNAAIELSGGSRIKDGWYLSSSEKNATNAWSLYLSNGGLHYWYAKVSGSLHVRAVAAFL